MDYISGWLSHHLNSVTSCYNWYSITFHVLLAGVLSLGIFGAMRRRDRALIALLSGLLLLSIGDPIRDFGLMIFVRAPAHYPAFFDYVEAQKPWTEFGIIDRNVIKPAGFVVAMVSAVIFGRFRKFGTSAELI